MTGDLANSEADMQSLEDDLFEQAMRPLLHPSLPRLSVGRFSFPHCGTRLLSRFPDFVRGMFLVQS